MSEDDVTFRVSKTALRAVALVAVGVIAGVMVIAGGILVYNKVVAPATDKAAETAEDAVDAVAALPDQAATAASGYDDAESALRAVLQDLDPSMTFTAIAGQNVPPTYEVAGCVFDYSLDAMANYWPLAYPNSNNTFCAPADLSILSVEYVPGVGIWGAEGASGAREYGQRWLDQSDLSGQYSPDDIAATQMYFEVELGSSEFRTDDASASASFSVFRLGSTWYVVQDA